MIRLVAMALILAVLLLPGAPGAAATEIGRPELADLAARAQSDPDAIEELRGVTSVAGRPVDMEAVLDVAPAALAARLESMTRLSESAAVAPAAEIRDAAREILSGPEYESAAGARGQTAQAWLVDLIFRYLPDPIARILTSVWFWIGAGLLALGLILRLAFRTSQRRATQFATGVQDAEAASSGLTAAELESAAAAAEAAGRFDEALRLRFRAGLLRLGDIGVIRYTDSMSTAAVSARVGLAEFDAVAGTFDRVHYGKLAAEPGDVTDSRERWPRILAAVRGRDE